MSSVQKDGANTVVIVHGKSEYIICEFLKRKLRLPIIIESKDKGKKSIQINALESYFRTGNFRTQNNFIKRYPQVNNIKGKLNSSVKIFTIMDTDDCSSERILECYKNISLFKNSNFYNHIVPIYNIPSLDYVMESLGYIIDPNKKPNSYKKIFTDTNNIDYEAVKTLHNNFLSIDNTNLNELFEFCMNEYKRKIKKNHQA